jgi:prepilin-type processing-associated H-X9-DG protein
VANICTKERVVTVPCVVTMDDYQQYIAARSAHPGGVNSALGDGSVRWISNYIDVQLWRAICSSRGNEAVGPPD